MLFGIGPITSKVHWTPESCNKYINLLYSYSFPSLPKDPEAETLLVMGELGLVGKEKEEKKEILESKDPNDLEQGEKEEETSSLSRPTAWDSSATGADARQSGSEPRKRSHRK